MISNAVWNLNKNKYFQFKYNTKIQIIYWPSPDQYDITAVNALENTSVTGWEKLDKFKVMSVLFFYFKSVIVKNWAPDGVTVTFTKRFSELCKKGSEVKGHSCGKTVFSFRKMAQLSV